MDTERERARFMVQKSREGVWYVIVEWTDDGTETVKVCATEAECRHWINTKSAGWLEGRRSLPSRD